MNKLLIFLLFFVYSINAIAQTNIKGNIIDNKTRRPVEGATVMLMPAGVSGITNESGSFSFKGKFDSSTTITVNTIGYATQSFTMADFNNNTSHIFETFFIL